MNSKNQPADPRATAKAPGHAKRARRNLVALGSAAVLAAYAAGFLRTASAAHRLAAAERKRPSTSLGATARAVATAPATIARTQPPAAVNIVQPTPAAAPVVPAVTVADSAPAPATTVAPSPVVAPVAAIPVKSEVVAAISAVAASASEAVGANSTYKDGVYYGWGHCRHGDLQASVAIKDGRITAAAIAQCFTRYSRNVISRLPPQVVARQSPNVDWVSGATESSDAYYDALVEALKQAK